MGEMVQAARRTLATIENVLLNIQGPPPQTKPQADHLLQVSAIRLAGAADDIRGALADGDAIQAEGDDDNEVDRLKAERDRLRAAAEFAISAIGRQSQFWANDPILARVAMDLEDALASPAAAEEGDIGGGQPR